MALRKAVCGSGACLVALAVMTAPEKITEQHVICGMHTTRLVRQTICPPLTYLQAHVSWPHMGQEDELSRDGCG